MKVMAIGPVFNEGDKATRTIKRFTPGVVDEVVVVDDCSTDGSVEEIKKAGVTVLRTPKRSGPGTAIRLGFDYGLSKGVDVFIVFAMNGKDNPEEIPRVLEPVKSGTADYVQGSRYLPGGGHSHMPFERVFGIWFYSSIFSLMLGKKVHDATNGFRAIRASLLRDSRINLWQTWLDGYPLETYLFVQAVRCGYRVVEVPVTKTYPPNKKNYTKIRPFIDWWHCFKPLPYLVFGIRK